MHGFSVMWYNYATKQDEELFRVTWGDVFNIAHVENLYGGKHIKALELYGEGRNYDIPFTKAMEFLETRTVPKTRVGIETLLRRLYKIKEYNPLWMVQKDHGVSMSDYIWVKFLGEDIEYKDVAVRQL